MQQDAGDGGLRPLRGDRRDRPRQWPGQHTGDGGGGVGERSRNTERLRLSDETSAVPQPGADGSRTCSARSGDALRTIAATALRRLQFLRRAAELARHTGRECPHPIAGRSLRPSGPFAHSKVGCASPSMASLAAYAGSWGMGTPSQNSAQELVRIELLKLIFSRFSEDGDQSSRQT